METNEFLSQYKPGQIVYPRAVARCLNMTVKEAYKLCESKLEKDLKSIYMVRCPRCSHLLETRFYSIADIPEEIGCHNCDHEFEINDDAMSDNVIVLYEKI